MHNTVCPVNIGAQFPIFCGFMEEVVRDGLDLISGAQLTELDVSVAGKKDVVFFSG